MSFERLLLDALRVGVVALGGDGRISHWNAWMAETSGVDPSHACGRRLSDLFPQTEGTALADAVDGALRRGLSSVLSHNLHPTPLPLTRRGPDGRRHAIDQSILVRAIGGEDGSNGCLIQVTDVSAAARREDHLRDIAGYSRMLFEVGVDPLATIDRDGRITDVNPAFETAAGRRRGDLLGFPFGDLFSDRGEVASALATALTDGAATDTPLRLLRTDGTSIDVLFNFTVFSGPDGREGVFASARDVTERLKAARELEILATTDSLTGLVNRRYFLELAEKEVERANRYRRSLALFTLDLDHFKRINDTLGHGAGDEVLRRVAETCRETLRGADTIGRLGGEELAILVPETGADGAIRLGERLRSAIAGLTVPVRRGVVRVTTSLGAAILWPDESLEDFLTRSDNALYEAKRLGRNRVSVDCRVSPVKG
jgi:diguanylate cyclase (GGDEF)-like protein/PAS domain S-box-containing protein